ncbi:MAG: tellurite resistance protein TehB [Gemmatimonadetes bacterium]|nr:tellurite resistance protein TehB [Gemmatimonadota bacterium]
MTVQAFYDDFASRYHLVYEDWNASIARQGAALDALLQEFFPGQRSVYDVAVGIGTQSLGLARRDYDVVGSDLSTGSVQRATHEAHARGLTLPLFVADFRHLPVAAASVPVLLCCDNALPHLASAEAILATLREWYACVRPDGGCLISMRDYGAPPPVGTVEDRPYGERTWNGRRYHLRQRWRWQGAWYETALEMTALDGDHQDLPPITTSYLAITPAQVAALLAEAGFTSVRQLDRRFFQPVLIRFKPPVP